jgi:predicted amidohydrolase YtcJ
VRFRDAHTHLAAGAVDLSGIDLRGLDAVARVEAAARERPEGAWIRGWGWNGASLEGVAPSHPIFLARADGHAAWLNAPAGDALGIAAGIVSEDAYEAARRRLPELPASERDGAIARQARTFARAGIARVDDFVEPWAVESYARLADRGALPVSVALWLPATMTPADARAVRAAFPCGRRPVATAGIKLFADGTLGARTAALGSPYADAPATSGALRLDERELAEGVLAWASDGWRVAIHAIGDRAVSAALSALAAAPRRTSAPHRIEHAQLVRVADLSRFRALGVVASVQPGHFHDDAPWREARLGAREGIVAYPIASLARAGARLVFGSDWPVSRFEPEAILHAATDPLRDREAVGRRAAVAALSAW